jgi:hypothetical protein
MTNSISYTEPSTKRGEAHTVVRDSAGGDVDHRRNISD